MLTHTPTHMPTHMPKRHRLALIWISAALLAVAAFVLTETATPPPTTTTTTGSAVQHAGLALPQLLAAGMLTVAVSLMTPTVMFYWRRRQYRHILRAERG